jgi:hypothetical protein
MARLPISRYETLNDAHSAAKARTEIKDRN